MIVTVMLAGLAAEIPTQKNPPKVFFLGFFGFQRKSLYFIPYTIISLPNKLFAFF